MTLRVKASVEFDVDAAVLDSESSSRGLGC